MATANVLYSDSLVEITEDTLCFRDYYFPIGSKCFRLADIENITAEKPNWLNGQFRIQGTSDLRTWFPRDWHRPSRSAIFTATLRGSSRRVGFTVENANSAEKIFRDKSLLTGTKRV